ncbi:hypothetical protein RJT34_28034 [Clitoria ternatea]|uniref:Uncharacterized protein n=1 Tax=Clitoria ternatea TaxID=43366 RepID=A0AAN9IBA6_CLITE
MNAHHMAHKPAYGCQLGRGDARESRRSAQRLYAHSSSHSPTFGGTALSGESNRTGDHFGLRKQFRTILCRRVNFLVTKTRPTYCHGNQQGSCVPCFSEDPALMPQTRPLAAVMAATDNNDIKKLPLYKIISLTSKHMELDIYFVWDMVRDKQLTVAQIPSQDQIAHLLTKDLPPSKFLYLKDKLSF